MPFDNARYNSLIARASFDCSFYKGTIQDQSKSRLAMTAVGSPTWTMVNGLPALRQNAAGDQVRSGAVASVVETSTQPYWVECVWRNGATTTAYALYQFNGGGWTAYADGANRTFSLGSLTAAGALARYCFPAVGSAPTHKPTHFVACLNPVALSGLCWVNGVPTAVTFVNAAPPVTCAATNLIVSSQAGSALTTCLSRVWQGTPTNADAAALYGAARALTGGEV
jgi:hypothetical protein